jgi:hypothetical protein
VPITVMVVCAEARITKSTDKSSKSFIATF